MSIFKKKEPKKFTLKMSVSLGERQRWNEKLPEFEFTIEESCPEGANPVDHLRRRFIEELYRHAPQVRLEADTLDELAA